MVFVPAASFENEGGGTDKFLYVLLGTLRTHLNGVIADFLKGVKAITAIRTFVLIDRHTSCITR